MRKIVSFLIVVSFVLTVTGCASVTRQIGKINEADKFETPEQVADAFCQAIGDNDIDAIKSMLAAPDMAKSADIGKMFDQMGYYDISFSLVEPTHETAIELNTQRLEGRFFMNLQYFYFGFFIDDIMNEEEKASFKKSTLPFFKDSHMADQIIRLMEDVDYESFSGLEIYDIIDTESLSNREISKKRKKYICKNFGADDYAEFIVVYELNDELYIGGMSFLQYDEGWKLYDISNYQAGLFLGMVESVSLEKLEELYESMQE